MLTSTIVPDGWRMVPLGELGDITGGSTPSTKVPAYWDGDIPWLTPSDVTKCDALQIAETSRQLTAAGLASCAAKLLPPGTVLMTSRATIGEAVINTVPMATNQGFINVACNKDLVCREFLVYWIKQNKRVFEERSSGATFNEISRSNFKTILIALPPLIEQQSITSILQTVQDTIQTRRHELALERERKAALMQHVFTYGAHGEPRKQTKIGEMPERWRVVSLGEVARIVSGGTPDRTNPVYWGGNIPWVKSVSTNLPPVPLTF